MTQPAGHAPKPPAPAAPAPAPPARRAAAAPETGSLAYPLAVRGGGQPLDSATRAAFEPGFGQPLDGVRVHTGPEADASAREMGAVAYAAGSDLVFRGGAHRPGTPEGKRLLGHELAHAVQSMRAPPAAEGVAPAGGAAEAEAERTGSTVARGGRAAVSARPGGRVQAKRMADATAAERGSLFLASTRVAEGAAYDPYFEKLKSGGWGTRIDLPAGVKLELTGIDVAFAVPIGSVAMHLHNGTYTSQATGQTRAPFEPGATTTLHLPLKKHGLVDGDYRFSWVGTASSGTIYVELVSGGGPAVQDAPTVALPAGTAALKEGEAVPSGSKLTAGAATFTLSSSWAADQVAHLKRALELIPAGALAAVDGMKFSVSSGTAPAGEDGHYEQAKHEVVVFTTAWAANEVRYGGNPWAVQVIVHEIGHAVDAAPLRKAGDAHTAGTLTDKQLAAVRGESDGRWVQDKKKNFSAENPLAGTDGDFRKAAKDDGVKLPTKKATFLAGGPSDYANKGWEDMYAESFSMYVTEPSLLELIRPKIHAYFLKKYPRKP